MDNKLNNLLISRTDSHKIDFLPDSPRLHNLNLVSYFSREPKNYVHTINVSSTDYVPKIYVSIDYLRSIDVDTTDYLNYVHSVETVTPGYALGFLDFIFFFSIILTMLVIITKNPIISVLYLIGLFFNIACYLILIGISFVGLSYLLVYVGAVSILFLFILMLINVRVSELIAENTNSIPLILIIPISFSYSIQQTLNTITLNTHNNIFDNNILFNNIYNMFYIDYIYNYMYYEINNTLYVTSNMWDGNISFTTHITSLGNIMYTNYSIWLIITSIILLLAMVGSIIITLKKK